MKNEVTDMSPLEITLESKCLNRSQVIRLHLPGAEGVKFPSVYFHHGLGYSGLSPWTETGLSKIADEYNFIIVTADADDGWFVNNEPEGRLWEDFFTYELPEWIEERFPALPERSARGQCGYSMGGYGAMMLTMLHPDRFSAVSTHCGSFLFGHEYRKDRPERAVYMKEVAPPGGRYDLYRYVRDELAAMTVIPAIRMDTGVDDYLVEQHREFHHCLNRNNIEHRYFEFEGMHSWSYVDSHLRDSLDFFTERLASDRPGDML